ncbi:uncharacterized protein LOC135127577 [Zophobas morio]|uniref:uncharacterized protein LOC135127577 n=1 Tax=Zophobas morio TaxID=2755281 RepID=UPI003083C365
MKKRMQLIPKKASHDRASQESKVTSTPRTMSPVVSLSPSVSTIANEEEPMEVDSNISTESGMSVHSDTPSVDAVNTSHRKATKVREVKWEGFWTSLQPKNPESLYYKLMKQPGEVESIAIDFMNTYSNDKKTGIILILQLCVDLCGYKKLSVGKVYSFSEQNSKEFVQKMKSELMEEDLKKTGKFVFMKISRFGSVIDRIISEFLGHVVLLSLQSEALFDGIFTRHVLEFINCMSFSLLSCIRVTGVVLVLKFLTAFVDLYAKYFNDVRDKNGNSVETPEDNKKFAVETFIDFLYIIYDQNVLIPDNKCYTLKVKCAQEMCHWIEMFPDIFILKRRCLGRLAQLVLDHNEIVRRSALDTCEALITNEEIQNEMEQRIEMCLKVVSTRIIDTSSNVAVKAVTIFTKAVDKYREYLTETYIQCIVGRMFEKNITLAKAAGKFLAVYLRHQNEDPQQLLLHLVEVAYSKKEYAERVPFFLESCVQCIPELEDWKLFVTTLLNEEVTFQTRVRLLHILNENVRFSLTGKFSKVRQATFEVTELRSDDRLEIVNVVIPVFENLMCQFQTDKTCLKLLVEILSFIKYDSEDRENIQAYYPAIFGLLRELFSVSTDKDLLEVITTTFWYFCEKHYYLAKALIDDIKNKHVVALHADLEQLSPSLDRNLLTRLRGTSMKLSLLFVKFDLTSALQWDDIFQVWDKNSLKALKYLVTCCKWYLVWSLRKFIKSSMGENGVQINRSLYNNCKNFIYGCLEILRYTKDSESFLTFEELCDLYASFEKELQRKRRYSIFFVKIDEINHQEALVNFVAVSVIENTELGLAERQKYLAKLVDIIYLDVIPVEYFAKILRYYHTHYTEFGVIMQQVITQLALSHPALPLVIFHTLAQIYNEILAKNKIVNIRSVESKQLQLLARKFSSLKEIKSRYVLPKMVNMSITFSFKEKQNYQFFYFARHFAKLLDEVGRRDAYNIFAKMVPKEDRNDDVLLIFAATLKQKK